MTEQALPFLGFEYGVLLALLLAARASDFISTWIATPNLELEANPIARRLGWRGGILLNVAVCGICARYPVPAIMIITSSALVAARKFQSAWIMRTMGEEQYRAWFSIQLYQTSKALYLFCTLAQVLITGGIGAALFFLSGDFLIPSAIGLGMIGYAAAVLIFTTTSAWQRLRRGR